MQSVKLVCVGDGTYKTRLLIAYTTNVGDPEYIPTVFDNYTAAVIIDGKPISAGLWDTAGQTDYDRLRPLSYPQTDVFLLVFSVLSPTSFQNAVTKWYEEVNFHCPSAEILLIGTEIEGRSGNIQCVTREEAMAEAKKIHAVQYMECSCATLQGVSKVFEEALRAAISPDTVRKQSAFSSYKSLHKLEGFISSGKWKDASKMLLENGVRQSDIEGLAEMATQKHGKKAAEFLFILYKREFLNPTFALPVSDSEIPLWEEDWLRRPKIMDATIWRCLYSHFAVRIAQALKDSPNAGLSLKDCALQIFFLPSQVPPTHPTIRNLQELDLSGNLLQSFPSSFFEFAPSLVRLNLSKNNLKAIPSGISHSSLLEAVNLSGNSIDRVQEWRVQSGSLEGEIFKLPALAELNLEDNRLTSVPLTLVQLALRPRFTLKLGGNTGLAIPPEALTDSADLVQYFTSLLKGEMIPWETVKLVTVGQENVGKTSLLGKLQNLITDGMSTDGICIGNLALGQTRFSTWDFGGQEVYYPTHQFFLTGCALYLVLFNLFNEEQSRIDYWLKQIHSLASRSFTRIILVATHVDEWTEGRNLLDVHLKPILDRYRKFGVRDIVGVSCTTGAGLGNLCSLLTQLSARPEFHRHVHTYWCRLAKEIDERRAVKPYLTWNEYIELAQSCGFETNIQRECENAASFLHEMGVLLHFKDPLSDLGNIVIINPQWLADVMATIITTKGNFVINGTLDHSNLAHLWKGKYPIDMHESLLRLLSFFGVMFPMRCSPPKSLVPCLLDEEIPLPQAQRAWPKLTPRGMTETSRMYTFPSLPLGFFGRIVARLLYLDIVPLVLWRYGMVATVNSVNTVLLLYKFAESSSIHSVHSLSLSLRSVSRMAYAVASEMISESINGTVNCFYENVASEMAQSIVCPGCIKSLDGISDQLSELVKPQGPPEPVLIPDLTKEDIVKTGELFSFSLMDVIRKFLGGCDSIPCPGIKKFRRLQIVEGIDHRTMHEPYYTPHTGGNVLIRDLAPEVTMGSFTLIHSDSIQYDRLHDKLGEGAFAIAFKASWKGKHVAVKELKASPEVTESPEIVKIFLDFKREASIMQTLHHPNVVELFGIMFDPLRIVMCLVPSGSLDKLLKKSKENSDMFPPSLQNRIIVDITKGLSFLHSQEPAIIHRDLRSPNVFLECLDPDSPTVAKIADFGLSERLIPQASGLLLTWQWIAPEAMDTRISSYDEKSDVYSLGMVILETYTRAPPFDELWLDPRFCKHIPGEPEGHPGVLNTMSIKSAICSDGLRPVLPASCPEVIQQLLLGMWDRNPQNRPGASLVLKKLNAAFGIVQNEPHESFHSPLRKLTRFSRVEIDLPPHHRAWAVICAGDSIWFGTEKEQSKELGSSRNSAHLPNFPEAPKKPPPLPQSSKILPPKPSAKAPPRPPSSPATPTPHAETEVHSSSGYACIFNIAPPKALCALEIQSSRVYGLVNLGYDVWCSSEEGFIHILRRDTLLVKKKFMPHASGRMIKCLTQVTTLEGDLQIWSCSPSPSDGEIAIIDSKYNVIGAIHVDQPTNFGEQVSRDRVWIGCYALIIIIDIETRKEVERFPLTAKAKVTGILSCQPRGSIEPLVWVSCGQNIFGLGLNNKELIFAMEFETTITCMQGLLNDFILCGDANSKIYIYSINDKHHEHHHLVTTLEGFPKKPVKAIAIVLPTTTSNSSSALMAAPSQSSSDASSSSTTSHTNNDVSIWVAYGSTDKAIVFSALS